MPNLVLFCILFYINIALAVPGRVLQGCTSLGTKVYCYGGYLGAAGGVFTNDGTDHITFDMSQTDASSATASPTWTTVNATSSFAPVVRSAYEITALDDTRYMVLGGGHYNAIINTPGAIYDSSSNSWSALTTPPYYMSEGAMVSSDANTVWAYGGKLNSTPGYTSNGLLKLTLPNTWTVIEGRQFAPPTSRYGHAMVMRNGIIYLFGGFLDLPEVNLMPNNIPLFNVTWYNTASDQWGMDVGTGPNTPTPRKYHTATLIAGSSKVLIYGGTNIANLQALPIKDYCYIYDLDTHAYSQVNMDNVNSAGPRIGHSAILYKQNIFLLFGYDINGNIMNDTHVIDISNPGAPVWAGQSPSNNGTSTGNGTSPVTSSPSNDSSSGIGSGAIAGIVVGVVAAAAIVGVIAFIFYRKKHNRQTNAFDYYDVPPPQDFNMDVTPTTFPENGNNDSTNKSKQQDPLNNRLSVDPVPTYPFTKPHDEEDRHSLPTGMTSVKPSGNE